MLKYIRKRKKDISFSPLKATDVLYQKMHVYNKEAREILSFLIEQIKSQNKNSASLKSLYQLMQRADDVAIDCAHKLAPYQTPKLESIEVRSKVEHKFVLRAPQQIKSVEQWMAQTGADKLQISDVANAKLKSEAQPPAESIHDYDPDEDEIETNKQLLN